jgi:sensory rhodopsin
MLSTIDILITSSVVFAVSSLVFLYLTARTKKTAYSYAFLVSTITLISSLIMLDGNIVSISSSGDTLYYTRWLGYMASCSLLMFSIAKYVRIPKELYLRLITLNVLTMLTGALASIATGWLMIAYFIIGGITYIIMLAIIMNKGERKLSWISKYVHLGWSIFPVIFLLSPEGFGVISLASSLLLYLVLDIFTKIVFYLELADRS